MPGWERGVDLAVARIAMTSAMIRRVALAAAVFVVLALARNAQAAPVYSCDAVPSSKCNGATYALEVQQSGDDYTLDFWINTTGYNGGAGDYIRAIALKTFVDGDFDDILNETLTIAPGGVANWDFKYNELAGPNGCDGGNDENFCAEAKATFNGGKGYPFTIGDELQWRFTFTYEGDLAETAHIKYLFVNADGSKDGDLGSWDLEINECVDCDVTVPEPATMTLFGLGLAALGASRFSRKR
jgi:hypothetical protein